MRKPSQPRPLPVAQRSPPDDDDVSWAGALFYLAIGAVMAVVAIGAFNIFYLEATVQKANDRHWKGIPNSDSIARPVESEDALTRRLLAICPKPVLSLTFSEADRIDGDYLDLYRKKQHLEKVGAYINCSMTKMTERYCNQSARSDLAEQLRTYIRMRREMKQFAVGLREVEPQGIYRVRRNHPHLAARYQQIDAMVTSIIEEEVDSELIANLRRLGDKGLFGASAFAGWFTVSTPEELVPFLADDRQQPASCR